MYVDWDLESSIYLSGPVTQLWVICLCVYTVHIEDSTLWGPKRNPHSLLYTPESFFLYGHCFYLKQWISVQGGRKGGGQGRGGACFKEMSVVIYSIHVQINIKLKKLLCRLQYQTYEGIENRKRSNKNACSILVNTNFGIVQIFE